MIIILSFLLKYELKIKLLFILYILKNLLLFYYIFN